MIPSAVEKAVEILESSPAWSEVPVEDVASRNRIADRMKELATYDPDVLRQAVQAYIAKRRQSKGGPDVASMSRLYVLSRYVFDVPDSVPAGSRRFGSFHGIPADSTQVNELWPWSKDKQGGLALTGAFGGYFGEEYLALQEFDHFRNTYGPRRINR